MPSRSRRVTKRAVDGQRRRGQHGRRHAIEQDLTQDGRHVDGRRAQEDAASAEFDEVHEIADAGSLSARIRNRNSSRISPARRTSAAISSAASAASSPSVSFGVATSASVDWRISSAPLRWAAASPAADSDSRVARTRSRPDCRCAPSGRRRTGARGRASVQPRARLRPWSVDRRCRQPRAGARCPARVPRDGRY